MGNNNEKGRAVLPWRGLFSFRFAPARPRLW